MAILLWFLSLAGYVGFLIYTHTIYSDFSIFAGILAAIVGAFGMARNNKSIMLVSFGFLLFGEAILYPTIIRTGYLYIWLAAIVLTLFFASLSMRSD